MKKNQYTWLVRSDKMESNGGMVAEAFRMYNGNNLLSGFGRKYWPGENGKMEYLVPDFVMICDSKKQAEETAEAWNQEWKKQGRYLFDVVRKVV